MAPGGGISRCRRWKHCFSIGKKLLILFFLLFSLPSLLHALPKRERRQQFAQQQQFQPQQIFPSQSAQQQFVPQQPQPIIPSPQQLTAYNEQYARVMLALAAGAYAPSPNPCIVRWVPDAQLWRLHSTINMTCDALDNKCSTYTVVSEVRREIVIVFRGTKGKEQLFLEGWQSLQPGTDFYGIGKVNKYFFRALNTLWPNVQTALADPRHADFQVTFTGHSLGGALASLASIRAVLDGLRRSDQIKLYTFGQPRVGNAEFAFKHDELVPHSFRVIFRMDIVPHMPPCAKNEHWPGVEPDDDSKPCDPVAAGIAYHHGTEIWYPNGMRPGDRYYECVGLPRNEDFHCSDSLSFEVSKYETYIWDHRHYFDHKVPAFGKLGCDPNQKAAEEKMPNGSDGSSGQSGGAGIFAKLANKVRTIGRIMGMM